MNIVTQQQINGDNDEPLTWSTIVKNMISMLK